MMYYVVLVMEFVGCCLVSVFWKRGGELGVRVCGFEGFSFSWPFDSRVGKPVRKTLIEHNYDIQQRITI